MYLRTRREFNKSNCDDPAICYGARYRFYNDEGPSVKGVLMHVDTVAGLFGLQGPTGYISYFTNIIELRDEDYTKG
jgi:hypothetical protein